MILSFYIPKTYDQIGYILPFIVVFRKTMMCNANKNCYGVFKAKTVRRIRVEKQIDYDATKLIM
jgi:hypothetical protein